MVLHMDRQGAHDLCAVGKAFKIQAKLKLFFLPKATRV